MTETKLLDPRTKLVIALCFSTLGVFINDISLLCIIFLSSIICSFLMGCNLKSIIKKIRGILYLLVFMAIVQSVFSPSGRVILTIGGLSLLTSGGLVKGGVTILRMAIVLSSALVMTTSISRSIVQGLVQWKIPYEVAFMVSIAIRFLPLLMDEMKDSLTAIQLRGVDIKKIKIGKRLKIYTYLLMPVVIGAIVKARALSTAMEMRAFRAYDKRTSYMTLTMRKVDYIIIAMSLIISIAVLTAYYSGLRIGGII